MKTPGKGADEVTAWLVRAPVGCVEGLGWFTGTHIVPQSHLYPSTGDQILFSNLRRHPYVHELQI